MITKEDITRFIQQGSSSSPREHTAPSAHSPSSVAASSSSSSFPPVNDRYTDIPNSNMRKIIAKRLTESKATVPHYYTSIDCSMDSVMSLRKKLKKQYDINVSVNDFVIKAAALALRDVPEANAKYNVSAKSINTSPAVDISIAVATPNGLITPILTNADKRSLVEINKTVKDLATRARDGKLKPEEFQGGSFSISNLGECLLYCLSIYGEVYVICSFHLLFQC
jgi:pyruvate dehydrogenase E2 component (dihydrolipoamide acetyltransferase)